MAKQKKTRREFLGQAGALGLGVGVAQGCATTGNTPEIATPPVAAEAKAVTSPASPPKAKPKPVPPRRVLGANDRIRVGFVGVGKRGSSIIQSTLKLKNVDVVAVCDAYDLWRERGLNWCREKQPNVKGYVRFEEMIEKEKLDAVITATPDHIHYPVIMAALDAGLDVYTEKPMTLHWEEAVRVADRVTATGAVLQVGTQLRSMSMYQEGRDIIQSGDLGTLVLAQVNRHFRWPWTNSSLTPPEANTNNVHWETFLRDTEAYDFDPLRYFWWRLFREYSNGFYGDLMLHHYDICLFMTGAGMPSTVKAAGGQYHFKDARTTPDTISALLEFEDKFHLNFTCTCGNSHYGLTERYLFTDATLEVSNMAEISIFRDGVEKKIKSKGILNEPHLQNFFDCMRTRETPIAPVTAGLHGAVGARMAWDSMISGKAASWDTEKREVIL